MPGQRPAFGLSGKRGDPLATGDIPYLHVAPRIQGKKFSGRIELPTRGRAARIEIPQWLTVEEIEGLDRSGGGGHGNRAFIRGKRHRLCAACDARIIRSPVKKIIRGPE